MKKYFGLFTILVLVFSLHVNTLHADKEDKHLELKDEVEVRRVEAKTKMDDLKTSIKDEKDDSKAKAQLERISSREKALNNFDEASTKINTLKDRVLKQIGSVSAKGIDTAAATAFELSAEASLKTVSEKIVEARAILSGSVDELNSQDRINLQILGKTIQVSLRDAQKSLNNAVKSLKEGVQAKIKMEQDKHAAEESADVENKNN